jgi:hypothetical protein
MLVATLQPVEANCTTARLIDSRGAYLVSNPNWGGADFTGGNGSCAYYGCYLSESDPPISANFGGTFWGWVDGALEGGDPAYFSGNDNGRWPVNMWTKSIVSATDYAYPAWFTVNDGPYAYIAGSTPNWGSTNQIDGCVGNITPTIPNDECTCVIFTDEWDGVGYFAVMSEHATANGNFIFDSTSIIRLAPIPQPTVSMSERDAATGDVTFQVGIPAIPAAGDYRDPQCPCDIGFRVYSQLVGRQGAPPTGRKTCTPQDYENDPGFGTIPIDQICSQQGFSWIPATDGAGGPQPVAPIGDTTTVRVDCDPATASDLYLSAQLVGAAGGGMAGPDGSANSFRVECGANVVDEDPSRPDRDTPGNSGDAPRGRDQNHGRGNANGRR